MKLLLTCLASLLLVFSVSAQVTIRGKVTDANNKGIAGATVKVEGTTNATTTSSDGSFTIQLTDGYETLVITAKGFQSQKVYLTGQSDLNISMQSSRSGDQVNFGIGSQSKDKVTSSVSSVDADNMIQAPLVNLEQANQGVTAGLQVQNSSGTLGEATKVRIRGGSSLTGSNEPLYVVDGVPLVSGSQSNINPNNIENIEVLKDASATAIYGTRAANGVIIITTKSGNAGKLKVNVDYQLGIANTPKKLDLFDGNEHRRLIFEFTILSEIQQISQGAGAPLEILVDGQEADFGRDFIEDNYTNLESVSYRDPSGVVNSGNPITPTRNRFLDSLSFDTDWQDEVFRTALSHTANIDFQGGKKTFNYFVAAGYTTQEGILIGNSFNRFNGTVSLNSEVTENLSVGLDFNYINTKDERLRDNLDLGFPLQALALPPSDTYEPDNFDRLFVFAGRNFYNPITEINYSDNFSYENSYIGSLSLNYKLNDKISFDVNGGIDFANIDDELELQPVTLDGSPNGRTLVNEQRIRNYVFNGWGTYSNSFASGNNLSVILGASYQESNATFTVREAFVPTIEQLNALEDDSPLLNNVLVPGSANILVSSYSRVSYSIRSKYDVQVTGRVDGSSKFSEDNRFGFFPAISAGWNIHNEEFYGGESNLRLRASYGLVGNTPFDDFAFRRNYVTVNFEDGETIEAIDIGNDNLKWETTSQLNVGVDFGFLDGKLTGSVDYYIKNTKDLLFPRPITLTSGQPDVLTNFGEMKNTGVELFISSQNMSTERFSWSTDFNISTNENTITNLDGNRAVVGVNAYIEDQPAGVFFARDFVGVDPATGLALYADGNGGETTDLDDAELTIIGDPNPDFFGGITNTLTYGNFDFSFLVQFVQGNDMYFATGEQIANSGINLQGQLNSQVDRWYAPGDVASNPGLDIDGNPPVESSRWIVDGSYVRLKNVMLTFNLPAAKLSQLGLSHLSVYVGATNLLTLSDYPGYDPDVNYVDPLNGQIGQNISRGIDNFSTPQSRMIMTGIKFGI
ncbi:SusC/RagA family TonB-linked outer membrane protein [Ekhidna sp.]|uniref:SusC/RagA family TonB-linked outer membrane protein n=1 Tax=Ekhidna sp. TaxID=2608089 RepID=UPI003B58C908